MNSRKLRLESLEERTLLAVTAGHIESAAISPSPTEATTWTVNTADDPASWNSSDTILSLREAIGRASERDRIVFSSSLRGKTIWLNGEQLQVPNGITVDATSIGGITIDAGGKSRVFYIYGGSSSVPVELVGLTITGGNAPRDFGGGIYNYGTLKITGSTVVRNTAKDYGGGIYNWLSGTLTVTDSTVSGNSANIGGGVYNDTDSTVTITGTSISGNSANIGGGVYNAGEATVTASTVFENIAETGGGFFCSNMLTVCGSAIFGNIANAGGGVYGNDSGILTVISSTISGNAADSGGGIYNGGGDLTVADSIVSLNEAGDGNSDIYNEGYPISGSNNIVGFDPGFVTAPIFESGELINLNELDLSLSSTSWAIDRGTNSFVETNTDLAGNTRICAAWKATATVDIGAYEYQGKIAKEVETPSLTVTTALDVVNDTDGLISLREAVLYANAGDVITFDAPLAGTAIILNGTELFIDKGVSIDAAGINGMTIDGDGKSRVFNVAGGTRSAPVQLMNLTVTGGKTGGDGGGILNSGVLTVANSALAGNTAERGGGIGNSGELTVKSLTVTGNSAEDGGGIGNIGRLTITNSIVSLNYAGNGKQRDVLNTGNITSKSNLFGTDPGFNTAPVFDGAGNLTNFSQLDLVLSPTSQAIDTGDNRYAVGETDLAGNPRIFASWKATATVDIGAYEYQERIEKDVEDPSLTVTTALDIVDDTDFQISLREAILYAKLGDTVTFDAALAGETIVLDGSELFIGEAISIDATAIGGMTIDGAGRSGVFNVTAGTASTPVKLIGMNITGGNSSSGGGIDNAGVLMISDSAIFGNSASRGGGIHNSGGLTISDTSVSGNSADDGGGIYSGSSCTLTVTNSEISGNTANNSGGGICNSGVLEITKSDVSLNSANAGGGGIYNDGEGNLKVANTVVSGNSAGSGGGVYNSSCDGPPMVVNSALFGNRAAYGGGLYNTGDGEITVINSTISGNSASAEGGGIFNDNYVEPLNSIVALNYAGSGRHEDICDRTGYLIPDYTIVDMDPGFIAGPLFDGAGNLLNYDTINLALSPTSMAIDSGEDSYIDTETDLAGKARFVGWAVDIGAYEFLISDFTVVTTNQDTLDFSDNKISLREAILYTTEGGLITFDSSLAGTKIRLRRSQLEINGGITIDASGIDGITVDAGWGDRALYVSGGTEEMPVELIGLTIVNGYSDNGGGIFHRDGVLVLVGCSIADNYTEAYGGGVYSRAGSVMMTDCSVEWNYASVDGGAVFNLDSLTMTDCSVTQNVAFRAGGIFNNGTAEMTGCVVTGNEAYGTDGGGIYNGETLTMTNCNVSQNSAYVSGGGIYNAGALTMTNSTFSGNSALSRGGGIYDDGRGLTMTNSIVALNSADEEGADISKRSHSIYAYNVLSSFADWTESENCLVYNPSKPLFEDAQNGDYSLAAHSQAVNKGNNSYVETAADLAGNPRIVGGIVDMGAYEYQGSVTEPLDPPTITTGSKSIYVSYGANRHLIQWGAVDNASGYELAYSVGGSTWTTVAAEGTSAVVRGLTYGTDVTYRVRALGDGAAFTDSDWSAAKTFNVCPMDINNDNDISGGDRTLLARAWLSEEGEDKYRYYCDIDADGDIGGADRAYLANNWLHEAGDNDLKYPRALAADAFFAEFASAEPGTGLDVF
ncbi:MAG: hypothetical protein IK105_00570 [Thermoguttaceae bacterium]|nr:hypothetical protein [Thermoguttaceae bacterium]